jgi:SAM-dependent methyltransferase
MDRSAELVRVHKDAPEYLELAAAESKFWEQMHPFGLEWVEQRHKPGPVDRYMNRRFSGDADVTWEQTIAKHGPFHRGAALGTGSLISEEAILETNPTLHLTFIDISEGPLLRRREALGKRFPGRVDIQVADLNFLELPADTYDMIVSSSTIHHVTNLEHLGYQLNRGLTAGGYFFLNDYVGEPRFDFREEKKKLYEEIYHRDTERQGRGRTGLIWLDSADLSPFCGVRSDEILPTFREFLEEIDVRTANTLITPLSRSRPAQDDPATSPWYTDDWVKVGGGFQLLLGHFRNRFPRIFGKHPSNQGVLNPEFLDELFLVGDAVSDANLLLPNLAFATYRKRANRHE